MPQAMPDHCKKPDSVDAYRTYYIQEKKDLQSGQNDKSHIGSGRPMKEFDYNIDYKNIMFTPNDTRYRIGRGEQGVLLVRPYTDDICKHWRFKTPEEAVVSSIKILHMYHTYKGEEDFVGMDMCRKFLEMGFTRVRRYANHKDGKKYDAEGNIKPQEPDALTSLKARSARIFKEVRDRVTSDPIYQKMMERK